MRKFVTKLGTMFAALVLVACGGESGSASSQRMPSKSIGEKSTAAWEYEAEVDRMTDRAVHYLLAEGKGDSGEEYGLAIKCDAAPQLMLDPAGAAKDIEWEDILPSGNPARHVQMRIGSALVAGVLTEADEEGLRISPQGTDVKYVSMPLLLAAVESANNLGADKIDKQQVLEIAEHAFAGLKQIVSSDKFLLSGVHSGEVIEFPAMKGEANAEKFLSACQASFFDLMGIAAPQLGLQDDSVASSINEDSVMEREQYCGNVYRNSSPDGVDEAAVEKYKAECPGHDLPIQWQEAGIGKQLAGPATRTTVHIAMDSLAPSDGGDGFSFRSTEGKEYYVTSNVDVTTPGAELVTPAASKGNPLCVIEVDGEIVKIETSACN